MDHIWPNFFSKKGMKFMELNADLHCLTRIELIIYIRTRMKKNGILFSIMVI